MYPRLLAALLSIFRGLVGLVTLGHVEFTGDLYFHMYGSLRDDMLVPFRRTRPDNDILHPDLRAALANPKVRPFVLDAWLRRKRKEASGGR